MLEHFKSHFGGSGGNPSESWAESDPDSLIRQIAENAPLFIADCSLPATSRTFTTVPATPAARALTIARLTSLNLLGPLFHGLSEHFL